LFIGTLGVLLVGDKAHEYDAFVVPFCNLQAMMLSAGTGTLQWLFESRTLMMNNRA
jgi:hypothetical protein